VVTVLTVMTVLVVFVYKRAMTEWKSTVHSYWNVKTLCFISKPGKIGQKGGFAARIIRKHSFIAFLEEVKIVIIIVL
jgi:hypothetical protein